MSTPSMILIVDDIEANRNLLNDFTLALGHTTMLAQDGRCALDRMRCDPPDVVLLDILMPGMDGYEVLEHMKEDTDLKHLPVIVISAVDEIDSVVRCIERGADDYLFKPFNSALLKARIGACLEKKRLRDAEQQMHEDLVSSHETLRQAEQARDVLSHMIVHDLNNLMMSVLGYTELLLVDAGEKADDEDAPPHPFAR